MSKTIKIIDLLNKFANKEELPTKIRYANHIWILVNRTYFDEGTNIFEDYLANAIIESLNDEVEIIEEDKKIKKIFIDAQDILNDNQSVAQHDIHKCITLMSLKINELVDEVNKLKESKE